MKKYEEISKEEMQKIYGRDPLTISTVIVYLAIGGGIVAIVKMIFSSSGRFTLPGFSIYWGN